MTKRLKKTDYIFLIALLCGFIFHLLCIFVPNVFEDETYYAIIPLRLINGEKLIQHEWNLTQFSSLFTYLPVYLWMKIKGSTEGIVLFLRCVYLLLHTTVATVTYNFFRKHGNWAIVATLMFYVHIPYSMYAISYCSMLVIFLLFLTFCILSIYDNPGKKKYIFAGSCYGICCVSNPIFCIVYFIYILACFLWPSLVNAIGKKIDKKNKYQKNHKKAKKKNAKNNAVEKLKRFDRFFDRTAIFYSFYGIAIVAIISIVFFFSTGGTITSIFENIEHILGSSEYKILSVNPMVTKIEEFMAAINNISFNMPFLLPVFFVVLLSDKKRTQATHRSTYLIIALLLVVLYSLGITITSHFKSACFAFPFAFFSIVCYLLTKKKNKSMFYCIWCPCMIVAVIDFFASNTVLLIISTIFSVSNIAGVFFARDLVKEIIEDLNENKLTKTKKQMITASKAFVLIGIFLQILFYMLMLQYCPTAKKDSSINKITVGPYAGVLMYEEKSSAYEKYINDLDLIKERSDEDDPVLVTDLFNWFYLYIDRPFATYTAWDQCVMKNEYLIEYYKKNNEKIPKYIYIANRTDNERNMNLERAERMFDFTQEELSNGILLTINECKFDLNE